MISSLMRRGPPANNVNYFSDAAYHASPGWTSASSYISGIPSTFLRAPTIDSGADSYFAPGAPFTNQPRHNPRFSRHSPYVPTRLASCSSTVPVKQESAEAVKTKKPPRPANAFMLFRSHWLRTTKTAEKRQQELSKEVAHIWNSMSDADRAPWTEKARIASIEHGKAYPGYKYVPNKKQPSIRSAFKIKAKAAPSRRACEEMEERAKQLLECYHSSLEASEPPYRPSPARRNALSMGPAMFNLSQVASGKSSVSHHDVQQLIELLHLHWPGKNNSCSSALAPLNIEFDSSYTSLGATGCGDVSGSMCSSARIPTRMPTSSPKPTSTDIVRLLSIASLWLNTQFWHPRIQRKRTLRKRRPRQLLAHPPSPRRRRMR
jgi:hypothetical protein